MSASVQASPATTGWQTGEPPKDGALYVTMGNLSYADHEGGYSQPFLSAIRWNGEHWVGADDTAVAFDLEERMHFNHWIAMPGKEAA